jgi:hypothetical protein
MSMLHGFQKSVFYIFKHFVCVLFMYRHIHFSFQTSMMLSFFRNQCFRAFRYSL